MMNRKLFGIFALMALLLAGSAFASVNPKVQLLNYSLSEIPAQPGHTLLLTLHMKSMESDNCAERVAVQVMVSYPLSVRGSDTQYIALLCASDPDSAGTFTFALPVDNLATSGTYPVSVSTTYEKRFTKLSESNTVNLQVGGSPQFSAAVSSSNPVDIYPGDSAKVTVSIQNTGSSMVQSARAAATSSGITVKWAGQTQDVGQIAARGSASATFDIEAPKDLAAGNYPLTVRLDYTSENRSMGSTTFTFNVPVKPKAEFTATPESQAMLPGQKRAVIIAFANTGTDDAKKVSVRIKPLFPFSTDGTVRYIESLPAGETANLTYVITVDKDATAGEQMLSFVVNFEDKQGKQFSDTADFAVPVRAIGIVDDILGFWYVWVALALGAGYFAMKKGKKKPALG